MRNTTKDILAAIAVAVAAVIVFVMFMGSMVMLGETAGRSVRARMDSADTAAVDTTATTGAIPADTTAAPLPLFGSRMDGPYDGVPVLCYHYLRGSANPVRVLKVFMYVVLSLPVLDDNEVWTMSQGAFEKQMRYLHQQGYRTISLDDLTRWQYGHEALPSKSVVITFDDGDRSVYDYAYPILKRYGFRATFFVITGHVGTSWRGMEFLTWSELREMQESGVFDIESHSHRLHYKVDEEGGPQPVFLAASENGYSFDGYARWRDAVLDDLERSRDAIARNVGHESRYLAWPYGLGDDSVDSLAVAAGFERTLLLRDGLNPSFVPQDGDTLSAARRLAVTRFAVSARTSLRAFRQMLSGEYATARGY